MEELTLYQPRLAVVVRRDMAKEPAVMNALSPIERSVFLATTAKTVAEYESKELAEELAKALKFIAKDVGYKNEDASERGYLVVRICEILKRYYAGFTLRDFRMAFEMSITGELDSFLPKGKDGHAERSHFQNFNAEYICKILNAYKMKRAGVLKKAYDAMPTPEEKPNPEKERECRNIMRGNTIKAFEFFKENGTLPELSSISEMLCYDTLLDAGLVSEIVVTVEEQKAILKRTINRLAAKGMFGDMRRLEQAGHQAPEIQYDAFAMARRKALKGAFEKMVADNIQIEDFIKFEDGK